MEPSARFRNASADLRASSTEPDRRSGRTFGRSNGPGLLKGIAICGVAGAVAAVTACSPPPPRSYDFFMEDSIARDGVLARCDRNPDAAQRDIECANARRAATAVLLRQERERRELLERESERKLEELRRRFAAEQQALLEAEQAAAAAADAEYEARWENDAADPDASAAAAAGAVTSPVAGGSGVEGGAGGAATAVATD